MRKILRFPEQEYGDIHHTVQAFLDFLNFFAENRRMQLMFPSFNKRNPQTECGSNALLDLWPLGLKLRLLNCKVRIAANSLTRVAMK